MTATTSRARTAAAPDWTAGLCAQTDPDLFFAEGKGAQVTTKTRDAKKVCGRCPIQEQCRAWALATEQPAGVWGGLDRDERRAVLGQRKTPTEICWENKDLILQQLEAEVPLRRIASELGVAHISLSRSIKDFQAEIGADGMGVAV